MPNTRIWFVEDLKSRKQKHLQGFHLLWLFVPKRLSVALQFLNSTNLIFKQTQPLDGFLDRQGENRKEMHEVALFRFRSPLLTESRLISVPLATKMFQFAKCDTFGFPAGDLRVYGIRPFP